MAEQARMKEIFMQKSAMNGWNSGTAAGFSPERSLADAYRSQEHYDAIGGMAVAVDDLEGGLSVGGRMVGGKRGRPKGSTCVKVPKEVTVMKCKDPREFKDKDGHILIPKSEAKKALKMIIKKQPKKTKLAKELETIIEDSAKPNEEILKTLGYYKKSKKALAFTGKQGLIMGPEALQQHVEEFHPASEIVVDIPKKMPKEKKAKAKKIIKEVVKEVMDAPISKEISVECAVKNKPKKKPTTARGRKMMATKKRNLKLKEAKANGAGLPMSIEYMQNEGEISPTKIKRAYNRKAQQDAVTKVSKNASKVYNSEVGDASFIGGRVRTLGRGSRPKKVVKKRGPQPYSSFLAAYAREHKIKFPDVMKMAADKGLDSEYQEFKKSWKKSGSGEYA